MLQRAMWVWLLAVFAVTSSVASGQPSGRQGGEPGPLSPTVAWLEAQAARVEALEGLSDEQRRAVSEAFREAIGQIQRAAELESRAQELRRLEQDAPRQLAAIREELATPPPKPEPDVAPDATLEQLEQRLAQANADLEVARQRASAVDAEIEERQRRRQAIPTEIAQVNQALESLDEEIEALRAAESLSELERARLSKLAAERMAGRAELAALEAERDSYEARAELVQARRVRAHRRVARAEALALAWQQVVGARRAQEAERAAREARQAAAAVARQHPVLAAYAERTQEIAAARAGETGVSVRIAEAVEREASARKRAEELREEYAELRQWLRDRGITRATGLSLRRRLQAMPDDQDLRRRLARADARLEEIELAKVKAENQLDEARDAQAAVGRLLRRIRASGTEADLAEAESVARELVEARRALLETYIADLETASDELIDLERALSTLTEVSNEYRAYIDERIFWLRSVSGPMLPDPTDAWEALARMVDPGAWRAGLTRVGAAVIRRPGLAALGLLSLAGLIVAGVASRRELGNRAELVTRYRTDSFAHSLIALLLTVPLAAAWPWALWLVGRTLLLPGDQVPQVHEAGVGLLGAVQTLAMVEAMRQVIRPNGLAVAHFQWPATALRPLRRLLGWLMWPLVLLTAVSTAMASQPNEAWTESLGRMAFIVRELAASVLVALIFAPHGRVLASFFERNAGGVVERLRYVWYPLVVSIPAVLALLSLLGYHRTATQLDARFGDTMLLVIGLAVGNGMLMRWLFMAHRRLAVGEARRQLALSQEAGESASIDEDMIDVPAISERTRLLFRNAVGLTLLVGLVAIWTQVLPALRGLDRVELWPNQRIVDVAPQPEPDAPQAAPSPAPEGAGEGGTDTAQFTALTPGAGQGPSGAGATEAAPGEGFRLTLADLGMAVIIVVVTVVVFRHLPALIEIVLLQRLPLDAGSRYAMSTILRYTIAIAGVALAFGALGLSWSKVQWLAAALTFGLAFGLQEIFANFISGIIMLLERPVRVGDTVTVEGVTGAVTRIRMRATTILDWDRKELVIPNKTFITGQVINWTLSDTILRMILPVGVSYDSDVGLVRDTLLRVGNEHPGVLNDPKPMALFRGFGDSTLNFELRYFIPSMENIMSTASEMHHAVAHAFREAGIEIAYPQRDLHLRSSDELDRLRELARPVSRAEAEMEARGTET